MDEEKSVALLNVRNLRTHFDTDAGVARAVDGVSFAMQQGECVALVGESGCGKSVTALSIMRLLPVPPARIASGRILWQGRNLLELPEPEMCQVRGARIAMVFQEPQSALNPVFTSGNQVAEAYLTHQLAAAKREAWERAVDSLRAVGIPDPARRALDYPHQLSGGMKQRICIAMSLICSPRLLIADEPTTALDVTIQAQILELLSRLQRERGLALLLITHDLGIVAEMAARVFVMYAGKVVESARTEDLFNLPMHPYTQGLMRARPEPGGRRRGRQRLAVIPGMVPAATQFRDDCRFRPRCPRADGKCFAEPPLVELRPGHCVACWHPCDAGQDAWGQGPASGRRPASEARGDSAGTGSASPEGGRP
jgi:oligopeptide/dipeptide ABC transporter ATP-binding protein